MQEKNRLADILPGASNRSATYNMKMLLNVLTPSTIIPDVDKYYVFVYKAKTKGITYDQHPLVVVTGLFRWGFTGWNMHLNQPRRYSWGEVVTNLYLIEDWELSAVENYPITLLKKT